MYTYGLKIIVEEMSFENILFYTNNPIKHAS